ncbi:hypothetical protein ACFP8W_15080, partial [Nocardioides hankookensis]
AGRRGVEIFMQEYFRHATTVGDLTRILLTKLEASQQKSAPLLERIFRRRPKMKPDYKVIHNRLDLVDPKTFLDNKLNLLRIFEEALRTGGVLAIWSAAPAPELLASMSAVFGDAHGHGHDVLLQDREETYWLYVARVASGA